MDHHLKTQYRAAAFRATRVYPGVVGQVLSEEILSLEEFGWLPGANARGTQLIAAIEAADLPGSPA